MAAADIIDRALDGFVDDEGRDLAPAVAVAVGLIATALAANAWLIHMGHAPLTALAESAPGRAFRDHFDRHCKRTLLLDPYSIAGRLIPRRFP